MSEAVGQPLSLVERMPPSFSPISVTGELDRILTTLRKTIPDAAQISFDFDGTLHVHIDVRQREQVMLVQALLPALDGGRFHTINLGKTPHHPFLHRISAVVDG